MKRFVLVDGGFKVNLRQAIWWGQKCLHKYIRLSPQYLLEGAR